jgi:amidase
MSAASRIVRVGWSLLVETMLAVTRTRATRLRPLDFAPFVDALAQLALDREDEIRSLLEGASLPAIQVLMDRGELSSEEMTLHFLARIRRDDPWLGSIIELNPSALSEARAADLRRRSEGPRGTLDGITIMLKDNIETAGPMRTTAGTLLLAEHVADGDAPLVTALRAAGAVILGKANLSELAGAVARTPGVSAVGGQTSNPYGHRFTPGGSSSGSAVSVGAGLCLVSVGTETSGSLIAPAAFNGVVGMKPSRGLVSREGIVPLVRHQDSAGPIARCVADAAALLSAIATSPLHVDLSPSALKGVAVGVLREDILAQKTPFEDTSDNEAMLARIVAGLDDAGASAKDVVLAADGPMNAYESGFARVVMGGLTHDTMGYLAGAGAATNSLAELHGFNLRKPRTRMPKGQFLVSLAYLFDIDRATYEEAALEHRAIASRILDATFDASGVEVLASISNRHSNLYATAGFPAITVPLGLRSSGMPVGVTLIGRIGNDARLLGYAFAFEQATRLRVKPPDQLG